MLTLRATVPGPWGPIGSEIHVKEPSATQQRYIETGVLVEVETYAGMTAKERAIARAEALGLDTKGTQKQIEDRIDAHEAAQPVGPETGPTDPASVTPTAPA